MTQTVREFSSAGPCLILGQFVRRTPMTIVYREWLGGDNYGKERRVGGWKVTGDMYHGRRAYVHIEPCKCCKDHAETKYPHVYMD